MPVIRISDPTWDRLKRWAVPLEDGPDDAVRKALDMADEHLKCPNQTQPHSMDVKGNGVEPLKKVPKGARVPEGAYKSPILAALYEMGGSGRVHQVLDVVESKIKGSLGEIDYQPLPGSGAIRWRNTAMWERKRLIEEGLLRSGSPKGIWELTEQGIKAVEGKGA